MNAVDRYDYGARFYEPADWQPEPLFASDLGSAARMMQEISAKNVGVEVSGWVLEDGRVLILPVSAGDDSYSGPYTNSYKSSNNGYYRVGKSKQTSERLVDLGNDEVVVSHIHLHPSGGPTPSRERSYEYGNTRGDRSLGRLLGNSYYIIAENTIYKVGPGAEDPPVPWLSIKPWDWEQY